MKFRLANNRDDREIRELMRKTVVPGHIRMIYTREPSFFDSLKMTMDSPQVIVAEREGKVEGMGIRSERRLYVNGKPSSVGYLSGLKLSSKASNLNTLTKGYAFLRKLHSKGGVSAYLTTIIDGNNRAKKVLTSGRGGLPSYTPFGTYVTRIFPVRRKRAKTTILNTPRITSDSSLSKKELLEFLATSSVRRQFFPSCEKGGEAEVLLETIGLENVIVARNGSEITGMMAIWDQTGFKQQIIEDYSPSLRAVRPFFNAALNCFGRHSLPAPGTVVRYGVAALICVKDDNHAVFKSLIKAALTLAGSKGIHYLAFGAHEQDPMTKHLESFFSLAYRSELYIVSWDDDAFAKTLDSSLAPYLELGTL